MKGRNRLILFVLSALTVLASIWVTKEPVASDSVVAPVTENADAALRKIGKNIAHTEPLTVLALDKLQRNPIEVGELNPFGMKSWYAPPPTPPAAPASPPPPPKPTAPPLPFTYVGKLEKDVGDWVIYLAKRDESYAVSKGETFDNVYKFEGIEQGNLVIQYLPLAVKQILPIGADN